MTKEKKFLIYGIGLVLVTFIGVTLAYFMTMIQGDKKDVTINTGDLRVIFNNGDEIVGSKVEPGWTVTKTFSIENKSKTEYKYNIIIQDLINTFVSNNMVYKITSTNSGLNMTDYDVLPKSDTASNKVLSYNNSIAGKTTQEYTIEIKFKEEDRNQYEDMGKILSGNLYIEEGTVDPTLANVMLRDNPTVSEKTSFFSTTNSDTTGTIYKTTKTQNKSVVYYYAGNTTNNWVKFGKYSEDDVIDFASYRSYSTLEECRAAASNESNCRYTARSGEDIWWRIIRTNEDGGVRLLYVGNKSDTTDGVISISLFNGNEDALYAGYKYGTSGSLSNNRSNNNSSFMKQNLDGWYVNNLITDYDKYISKSAIYCNDRDYYVISNSDGTKKYTFKVGERNDGGSPSYSCNALADRFSSNTELGGNGQLKCLVTDYFDRDCPIALITLDELVFAGARSLSSGNLVWYNVNSLNNSVIEKISWWTMSPYSWETNFGTYMSSVKNGVISYSGVAVNSSNGVRPVISLDKCVRVTGTGTATDPYVVDENASTC